MRRIIILVAAIGIGMMGWTGTGRAETDAPNPNRKAEARAAREAGREKAKAETKIRRDAQIALAKAARAKAQADAEAKAKARAEAHEKAKGDAKADAAAKKEQRDVAKTPDRAKEIDNREARQAKRIDHGIKKGYLTDDEIAKLKSQQDRIISLEEGIKEDGKITREEFKNINQLMNDASRCIWAEKHDKDGDQMPTYRLGKNVFAKSDFTAKMADENLSKGEAKALLADFNRLTHLKRILSTGDLREDLRATYQNEYNGLLNKYFEVK